METIIPHLSISRKWHDGNRNSGRFFRTKFGRHQSLPCFCSG